jgi:uncharacterized protein with von Willebrand factor type A (vWA) domain
VIVVALDGSLEVVLHDLWTRALAVATSLVDIVEQSGDSATVVVYDHSARTIESRELAGLEWNVDYGTNVHQALQLVDQRLASEAHHRHAIFVSDAEPTAHQEANGHLVFCWPPLPATVAATMAEATRLAADGVHVHFIVLRPESEVGDLARRIAEITDGSVTIDNHAEPVEVIARRAIARADAA